jgi:hypothetical protein
MDTAITGTTRTAQFRACTDAHRSLPHAQGGVFVNALCCTAPAAKTLVAYAALEMIVGEQDAFAARQACGWVVPLGMQP